jgi:predicted GIY-YIG superfamily endonuclease
MPGAYIYTLGSHTGTLYIGVTSNLYLRVMQHKEGTWEGFTASAYRSRSYCRASVVEKLPAA